MVVMVKIGIRMGLNFCTHQALGSPRNDAAPATKTGTKWSPSWPRTSVSKKKKKRVGGGRMLQAQLGPHPISILRSELHHPESLAPNSQLPLWSISRWRLNFTAFFFRRDTLTDKNKDCGQ